MSAHRRRWALAAVALPLALIASSTLVYKSSVSAFTATTSNSTNTWQTGGVAISDDDSGSAMFTATGLYPGSTGNRCIKVDYTGSLAATIALYGSGSGALMSTIDLTVETGTGGTFAAGSPCTGFTPAATVYSGTLANFVATHTNFTNGNPTTGRWAPTGAASRVYRFTYTLQSNPPQNSTATATFTWEAQSN